MSPDHDPPVARGKRKWHALAAVVFLGCALWTLRGILPAPARSFPFPARLTDPWGPIARNDQKLTAANITWNAHRFVTRPWALYEAGQCYPASAPATLGPHQLGEGLLGVVPYVLTADPVFTYNVVVLLTLWLPGLAMYALVFAWTGSIAGAFIAGLVFAFHPQRITDVVHPDVHGNHWTPLVLLFVHQLFVHRRWRDAAGLTLFLVLQVLGSVYQLLALTVLVGTYGIFLAARYARALPRLVPKLAVVIAATVTVAWLVLGPYLHTRAIWGSLGGRPTFLHALQDFTPGHAAYPGSVLVALAVLGLVDRLRGARNGPGYDPRLALLVAGLMVVWAAVASIPIPFLAIDVPSLFTLAGKVLPGLDAVRAGAVIGFGVVLATAVLAGYGVAAIVERRSVVVQALVTSGLTVAILVEVLQPGAATSSFGSSTELGAYVVRPPAALLALYAKASNEAVLDVPFGFGRGRFGRMADGVFLGAFHFRPVGACYNSFKLPLHDDIEQMANRLGSDDRAAEALHALGFGTVVVDDLRILGKGSYSRIATAPGPLVLLGRAAARSAYRLEGPRPVAATFTALRAADAPTGALTAVPPEVPLAFTFRNGPESTYRHPEPIEPTRVRIAWRAGGTVVREDETTILLPVALAAGEEISRVVTVHVPPTAGAYEVTLAPADAPDLVLARHTVQVTNEATPPP